jgi:translation initiation factor IF-2
MPSRNARTELLQHEIQVETLAARCWTSSVGDQKLNIDRLLETIGLQSEILDLRADPNRPAEGTVIEARLDRGRGPVATVWYNADASGRRSHRRRRRLGPRTRAHFDTGVPVETPVMTWQKWASAARGRRPPSGRRQQARARSDGLSRAAERDKAAARATGMRGSLEQTMSQLKTAGRKEFPLVIKADVQGSLEAITGALDKLGTNGSLHGSSTPASAASPSDVTLAKPRAPRSSASTSSPQSAGGGARRRRSLLQHHLRPRRRREKGDVRLLAPTLRETMLGNATILEIFWSPVGNIAGCRVTDGVVERGANVRLIRDNVVVHEQAVATQAFKDDARWSLPNAAWPSKLPGHAVGDAIEC